MSDTYTQGKKIDDVSNAAGALDRKFGNTDALAPGEVAQGAALFGAAADGALKAASRFVQGGTMAKSMGGNGAPGGILHTPGGLGTREINNWQAGTGTRAPAPPPR